MQQNNFFAKLREDRNTRAIAATVVLMLVVLSAIIITTVIANREVDDLPTGSLPAGSEQVTPDVGGGEKPTPPSAGEKLPTYFLLPVSGVLTKEHDEDKQVFSDTMKDYRVHLGIDIATVAGASVSAMADGVVAEVWDDLSMGHCVAVKHGGDAYTIYKNLAVEDVSRVSVGKQVKAGDVIGLVGESAMVELAEDPHLHLEMTVGGLQVNPTDYLSEDAMNILREDTNFEDAS